MYKDKVVLVTGSSRGVGLEIANHFLKHQATVIGISKGNSKIENPNYHHFSLDIGDPAAIASCFSTQIAKKFKRLDIVINNQTGFLAKPFDTKELGLAIDKIVNLEKSNFISNCRTLADDNFSFKAVSSKYNRVFSQATNI